MVILAVEIVLGVKGRAGAPNCPHREYHRANRTWRGHPPHPPYWFRYLSVQVWVEGTVSGHHLRTGPAPKASEKLVAHSPRPQPGQ